MNRKMKWLVAGTIAGLLVVAVAVPALAAGPNSADNNSASAAVQARYGNCQGLGFGSDQAAADLLGLTQEQISEQRLAGKSLVEIASEQGVSEETLIDAIMAEKLEMVQNRVEAGTLTQEQADLMLVQMRERVQLAVNRTTVGSPEWAGANSNSQNNGQNGQGMRGQGGNKGNQGDCSGCGQMTRGSQAGR
jgi:hypothetical protein